MQYNTFEELIEAYKSNDLPEDRNVWIDNDSVSVWYGGEAVYDGGPPGVVLEEVFDYLGIPWDRV